MEKKNIPERVLHIVSTMDRGGAESLLMNIYRNVDRTKLQFDFITHTIEKGDFEDEVNSLGGNIYSIPSLGEIGPIRYIKELINVITSNNYLAIHSHTDYQSGFPALAAKLCGIKNRICHSHSTNWPQGKSIKAMVIFKLLQALIKMTATKYCSCSEEAAEFLFGKSFKGKVNILRNGIDLNQFMIDMDCKKSVIQEFNLPLTVKIIGHVGRFSTSKNHLFMLKVFKAVLEKDSDFVLMLVGDGPLKEEIEKEANKLGISENIKFLGVREDIPRLMKAFDIFLFPSLFEGFGIVTIEAQCTGTPCVISDTVPKTTDMGLGLVQYIKLEEDHSKWAQVIMNAASLKKSDNEENLNKIIKNGYSVQENVPQWITLYGIKEKQTNLRISVSL